MTRKSKTASVNLVVLLAITLAIWSALHVISNAALQSGKIAKIFAEIFSNICPYDSDDSQIYFQYGHARVKGNYILVYRTVDDRSTLYYLYKSRSSPRLK